MSNRPPDIGRHLTPGRAILLVLGALLLAFLLASHLTGARVAGEVEEIKRRGEPVRVSELLPKVPPGQQNAADVYAKAFAVAPPSDDIYAASDNIEHWSPQQLATAAHLVAAYADYYRLLDEASRVDVCVFPADWDDGFLQDLRDLRHLSEAGRALAVRAQVQLSRGDLEAAAATCSAQLRLAEHARQTPVWQGLLVPTGQHWIIDRALARVLAWGDLSPATCRRLYAQLATPDWQATFARTLEAERALRLAELARVDRALLSRALHGGRPNDWQMAAVTSIGRPWCNLDKADYLQMEARRIEASRQPWAEANRRLRVIDGEPRNAATDTTLITWQVRQPVADAHLRAARTAAQDGAARIALALTIYRHDHGAYPASLAELTRAGWKLPLDPFTRKPYHYRREGKGFVVWSVGPDLTDNHATAYDPSTFREDQPGYDFVFRRPR